MARTTTASEENARTGSRRRKAAEQQENVNPHQQQQERKQKLSEFIADCNEKMEGIEERRAAEDLIIEEARARKKSINAEAKSIYDALDAEGVAKEEFQHARTLMGLDETQRLHRAASRKLIFEALGMLEAGKTVDLIDILSAQDDGGEGGPRH
ncbi:MAG: hypothetical protein KDB18_05765 [Salinibacterium sp.]|nr:hypothetical protein [Salinibacterium sp.]